MEHIDINILTVIATVISIIAGYFKIMAIITKREQDREKEMRAYVDKEISHLKETSINEIKNLEQKIDSLRDDLKQHQIHIIELLTKK